MITQISELLSKNKIEHRVIGDSILVRRGKKVRIPQEIDKDVAYLCGVICGDGCLDKPSEKKKDGKFRYRIQITIGNDEHLVYIKNKIKEKFDYEPVIFIRKDEKCKDIYIESSVIYFYFVYLGLPVGEKFGKLSVPSKISETKYLFSSFLSGLLDTDGSFVSSRIYLSQKDVEFLKEIRQLIQKFYGIEIVVKLSPFRLSTGKVYPRHYIYIPKTELSKILPFMDFNRIKIK